MSEVNSLILTIFISLVKKDKKKGITFNKSFSLVVSEFEIKLNKI